MIIRACLRFLGWTIFALFPGYWMFLSGFILHVIAHSCTKSSACLYETMQAAGQAGAYRRTEKSLHAIPQYILMFGFPLSGFLYTIAGYWPFVMNAVFCLFSIVLLCYYTEAPRLKPDHGSVLKLIKDVLVYLRTRRSLRWLTLYGGLTLGMGYMIIFLVQAGFYAAGGSVLLFSMIMPFFYLLRAISAQHSDFFFRGETHNKANIRGLTIITLGLGAALLFAGMAPNLYLYIAFVFIYMAFHGMMNPAFNFVYNDALSSDMRATAFAAKVIVMRLSAICLNVMAGCFFLWIGAQETVSLFGGLFFTLSLGLIWLYARNLSQRG